jgi:AcrR family transcriptional regulator
MPRKFLLADPARPEGPQNSKTRARIEDALIALMAEGEPLNHDRAAERAQVSRRTVYRYFPDQDALRTAVWSRLSPIAAIPRDFGAMLESTERRFATFDRNAAEMTVIMASAEGRAIRNVMRDERVAAFREMLAEQTAHLPEPARTHAIAAIQFAGSGFAWREMRDQWDMTGEEIAAACRWMIETLLAELRRGGGPG